MADTPNLSAAKLVWTIPWNGAWVTAVTFIGASRRLAAGNREGQLFLFDLPEQANGPPPAPVRRLDGHTNLISGLAVAAGGKQLISTSYDHTVRYWDLEAPARSTEAVVLDAETRAAAAKKSGQPVGDGTGVKVAVQSAARIVDAHREWVRCLALSADGTRMLTGDDHGQAILWDVADAKEIRRLTMKGFITALALAPDARQAVTCQTSAPYTDTPSGIQLWDLTTGAMRHDLGKEFKAGARVFKMGGAAFTPDGKGLALGQGITEAEGKLFLADPATGKKTRELGKHENGITALTVHPAVRHLVSCGRDTLIQFWQLDDGKLVKELGQKRGGQSKDWIHAVAFSADGLWAAAADMAGQINIWSFAG